MRCVGLPPAAARGGAPPAASTDAPHPSPPGRHSAHRPSATARAAPPSLVEDAWIRGTLDAASAPAPPQLAGLRGACRSALATVRMPTTRQEAWRFTDVAPLLAAPLAAAPASAALAARTLADHALAGAAATVVLVDGVHRPELSSAAGLPAGAFVGALDAALPAAASALGALAAPRGGPFATLNGAVATSAVAIVLGDGVRVEGPIHVLHVSSAAAAAAPTLAAPRLVIMLGPGAAAAVVEEWAGEAAGPACVAAVAEASLAEKASLAHAVVALGRPGSNLIKATFVEQAEASTYALVEARTGGALTRHDVDVAQAGPSTHTTMRHFLLGGDAELHDLHTALRLEHPDGDAAQLHKCIAASPTSRLVFDGGVSVARAAQRTDAAQLSRNLLLVKRASVSVKPNLAIVADDVKCTHGCAVSDLEEEALFYFLARGVDAATARRVLVDSFGSEVVAGLPGADLRARVAAATAAALAGVRLDVGEA